MAAQVNGGTVLRVVGFTDFVIAIAILTTPVLRSRIGVTGTYAFAAFLVIGTAATCYMARRMDALTPTRQPGTSLRLVATATRR